MNITENYNWISTRKLGASRFIYPVFKFGKKEHSNSLLSRGQVHLPTLHEFQDSARYSGSIHDQFEGTYILNDQKMAVANCIVYCSSQHFFSDTLEWALSQGKDSCVAIVDFDLFCDVIGSKLHPQFKLLGVGSCDYSGKSGFKSDFKSERELKEFLKEKLIFSKPEEYKNQFEVRAIWQFYSKPNYNDALTIELDFLRTFLIPINMGNVTFEALREHKKGKGSVGIKFLKYDGKSLQCWFNLPKQVLTPICILSENGWVIGVRHVGSERTFEGGYVEVGDEGLLVPEGGVGPIFLMTKLNELKEIQFLYDENFQAKKGK